MQPSTPSPGRPAPPPPPQIAERGAGGKTLDRRLFMQFLAFGDCLSDGPRKVIDDLAAAHIEAVVYADVNDPYGIAILTMHEDPAFFVDGLRPLLQRDAFTTLSPKPELTMFGRTYSLGYEPDLEETLFTRPKRTAMNPDWPWAVWYPLRRSGAFARLAEDEQKKILMEHGVIGFSFGSADLGHDIRLASFGLDQNDNDFVVGLLGKALHPLSVLVQTMRKTTQTSMYIERLGPFFVGKKLWSSQ